jgi:hypothetical protein
MNQRCSGLTSACLPYRARRSLSGTGSSRKSAPIRRRHHQTFRWKVDGTSVSRICRSPSRFAPSRIARSASSAVYLGLPTWAAWAAPSFCPQHEARTASRRRALPVLSGCHGRSGAIKLSRAAVTLRPRLPARNLRLSPAPVGLFLTTADGETFVTFLPRARCSPCFPQGGHGMPDEPDPPPSEPFEREFGGLWTLPPPPKPTLSHGALTARLL